MKILFTRFPLESAHGGAEVQTLSLMKGLSERGHDVAFLGSCPVLLTEVASLGLRVTGLEIGPPPVTKWGAVSFLWRKKGMQRRLEKSIMRTSFSAEISVSGDHGVSADLRDDRHIDAIFMLSMTEKLLLTETAVKNGIKVFWIEHDRVGPWLTKNPWLPRLRILSRLVTTICVSELSRKIYVDLGWRAGDVVAIPNGIDLVRFDDESFSEPPLPSPLPPGEGDSLFSRNASSSSLRLGCVARLSPEKGVDVLIQAVSGLPDVDLTIIGKGPEEGYLRKQIEQIHGTEMQSVERIRIIPHVDDLAAFYRSIDALVLPSRDNDPFGLVAAEAMACGTPVIVTEQCGIAGYLSDGVDAVIAKANSEKSLREAILRIKDPTVRSRLSTAGRKTAREKFSVDSMIERYCGLLR